MNKYICKIACMVIGLTLMLGCNSTRNRSPSIESENTFIKTTSTTNPIDISGWKPTAYKIVNNFVGVSMSVKEGTVSSKKLTVQFENNSRSNCIYGEFFCLEKKIKGNWYQVPVTINGNYGFNSIGYNLASGVNDERVV